MTLIRKFFKFPLHFFLYRFFIIAFIIFFSPSFVSAATIAINDLALGSVISINGQRFVKINHAPATHQFIALQPAAANGFADGMYLQDFTASMCASAPTPATGTTEGFSIGNLIDQRDGKTYTVRKFADGRCWMVTNLRYGGGTDGTSDYCAAKTTTRSATDLANSIASATGGLNPPDGSRNTLIGDCRDPAADALATSPCSGNTSCGYLYNWPAATQDAQAYGTNANYTQPNQPLSGICPAGWVLPLRGSSSGSFSYLHTQTGSSNTGFWQNPDAWNAVYAGAAFAYGGTDYQGTYGFYWSSTMSDAEFSYMNRVEATIANNSATYRKQYSLSVRCVKDTVDHQASNHMFTAYWTNWNNVSADPTTQIANNLRLREVPSYYKIIAVAFGLPDSTQPADTITFALDAHLASRLNYTKAEFISDIQYLKDNGQFPILSVGGASGPILLADANSVDNFVNSIIAIVDEYGFAGIDFNIENKTLNVTNLTTAIQRISSHYGENFIITIPIETTDFNVDRYGNPQGRYANMILGLKDIITMVNIQNYNTGSQYALDGSIVDVNLADQQIDFLVSTASVLIEKGLDEDQVGIGVRSIPYQNSAVVTDYVSAEKVAAAYTMLQTGIPDPAAHLTTARAYPGFQGLMIWTVNSDLFFYETFGDILSQL